MTEWVRGSVFKITVDNLTVLARLGQGFYQAQRLGLRNKVILVCVDVYYTQRVLVRYTASFYSASPLKHHATGRQWCSNPDHYPNSEPVGPWVYNSFVLSAKQSSSNSNFRIVGYILPISLFLVSRFYSMNVWPPSLVRPCRHIS